jgi:hypothetical protein
MTGSTRIGGIDRMILITDDARSTTNRFLRPFPNHHDRHRDRRCPLRRPQLNHVALPSPTPQADPTGLTHGLLLRYRAVTRSPPSHNEWSWQMWLDPSRDLGTGPATHVVHELIAAWMLIMAARASGTSRRTSRRLTGSGATNARDSLRFSLVAQLVCWADGVRLGRSVGRITGRSIGRCRDPTRLRRTAPA